MKDGAAGEMIIIILIACTGFGLMWLVYMWLFYGSWTYSKEEREQIKRAHKEKKLLEDIKQEDIDAGNPPVEPKISPDAEKVIGIVIIIACIVYGIL